MDGRKGERGRRRGKKRQSGGGRGVELVFEGEDATPAMKSCPDLHERMSRGGGVEMTE